MNNLSIAGRIGKVGELRYTQNGKAVINISVATDNGKNADGEKRQATWFEVALWEKAAESLAEYLKVGDRIGVTGQIRLQVDEGKDGGKYPKLVIDFPRVELMGGSPQKAAAAAPARTTKAAARPAQRASNTNERAPGDESQPDILDEDIPF